MIFFDAHVHIQERFDLGRFLAFALENLERRRAEMTKSASGTYFLLLTEAKNLDVYSQLKRQSGLPSWQVVATREEESLLLRHSLRPGVRLFLVAGRQIVTTERLEVLCLGSAAKIADGDSLAATVTTVRQHGGLAVLPWGAGKWLGQRGATVSAFLQQAEPQALFVGDNGGRPGFWPAPPQFSLAAARGIRLLPGSDPLPLPGEERRVGTYGALIEGDCSDETPAADLKRLLTDASRPITPFGHRPGAWQFFRTQLALRLNR
jgi:hypothetical protein